MCFILTGAALLLSERISGWTRIARLGLGAAVFFLFLITLLQQAWQLYPAPGPWGLLLSVLRQGTEFSRSANISAVVAGSSAVDRLDPVELRMDAMAR